MAARNASRAGNAASSGCGIRGACTAVGARRMGSGITAPGGGTCSGSGDRGCGDGGAESAPCGAALAPRSEEHTSELQSRLHLVCRLLPEKNHDGDRHRPRCSVYGYAAVPDLHSFPTRRSSDLPDAEFVAPAPPSARGEWARVLLRPAAARVPVPAIGVAVTAARSPRPAARRLPLDRKSTRLNSSHGYISYAVFCLKKITMVIGIVLGVLFTDMPLSPIYTLSLHDALPIFRMRNSWRLHRRRREANGLGYYCARRRHVFRFRR